MPFTNNAYLSAVIGKQDEYMAEIVNCYPVGVQTFEEIRNKGYLYLDKTKYITDWIVKEDPILQ